MIIGTHLSEIRTKEEYEVLFYSIAAEQCRLKLTKLIHCSGELINGQWADPMTIRCSFCFTFKPAE